MIDVLLLSGGKGTRSQDPSSPKSLQQLTNKYRVIDTIATSLGSISVGKVVAILGHFHKEQEEAFSEIPWNAELVITSSIDHGTSHAVSEGLQFVTAEWLAVIASDSALSFDFAALLAFAEKGESDVVFSARYSNHPHDSDALILGEDSRIEGFSPKGQAASGVVLSASGVVLVRRSALEGLPNSGDFQKNLFDLVESQNLIAKAWISRFYCRDTGTPERLAKARAAFTSGSAQFRGKRQIGAILIDRDGTLIPDLGDARQKVSREEFAPEITQAFLEANDNGVPIFIVTNQPGVAKAKITELDVEQTISDIQLELSRSGAVFDDYRYCVHHPEKGWPGEIEKLKVVCNCRKPSGGMGLELANRHHFSLKKSWVIGDSDADQGFAEAIEASFIRVSIAEPESVAQAIRKAIGEIRNAN
jgi:mannose-1-phosphate guanylyltransferase/phosphomannomutase